MSTVLILGAGFTRAAGSRRPISRRPPLDSDFFGIARAGKNKFYNEIENSLDSMVGEYSSHLMQSLETSASYLYLKAIDSPAGSLYHNSFISLLKLLSSVLGATTNDLPLGRRSLIYRFLLSEINRLPDPSDLTVITFNYDLVIERTLQEIASNSRPGVFVFPGCYRLEDITTNPTEDGTKFTSFDHDHLGVGILKLHGSMSWQSRHNSDTPMPRTLFSPRRELNVINSKEIYESLYWRRKRRMVYMKPIIVPPISGKRGMMHNLIPRLWNIAGEKLRDADRIVIAGYSCPPLDLEARMLLSENLRQNNKKRIYVIDPDAQSASKFIDMCGVTHSTIYSSISSWVDDAVTI